MPLACAHDSRGRTIAKAPPSAGLRVLCAGVTFEPECPDRFGAMLVLGGQMLPPRPVAPGYPEPTGTCETISAIFCKPRSPMGWPKRGRETHGCGRLMSQRRGGEGCLVAKNKDFIRANSGRRGAVAKKKLEFGSNPGYPCYPTSQNLMGWAHGRGAAAVFRPFPRFSRAGSLCCPHRIVRRRSEAMSCPERF